MPQQNVTCRLNKLQIKDSWWITDVMKRLAYETKNYSMFQLLKDVLELSHQHKTKAVHKNSRDASTTSKQILLLSKSKKTATTFDIVMNDWRPVCYVCSNFTERPRFKPSLLLHQLSSHSNDKKPLSLGKSSPISTSFAHASYTWWLQLRKSFLILT